MKVAAATATSVQRDRLTADTVGTSTPLPAGFVCALVMVSSPSGVGLSMTTLRDVRHRGIPRPSAATVGPALPGEGTKKVADRPSSAMNEQTETNPWPGRPADSRTTT